MDQWKDITSGVVFPSDLTGKWWWLKFLDFFMIIFWNSCPWTETWILPFILQQFCMFSQIEAEKWNRYTLFKTTQWNYSMKRRLKVQFSRRLLEMELISTTMNSDMAVQARLHTNLQQSQSFLLLRNMHSLQAAVGLPPNLTHFLSMELLWPSVAAIHEQGFAWLMCP